MHPADVTALTAPDKITDYLRDAAAKNPYLECRWGVCLDRKNKPISRTMVPLGRLTWAWRTPVIHRTREPRATIRRVLSAPVFQPTRTANAQADSLPGRKQGQTRPASGATPPPFPPGPANYPSQSRVGQPLSYLCG